VLNFYKKFLHSCSSKRQPSIFIYTEYRDLLRTKIYYHGLSRIKFIELDMYFNSYLTIRKRFPYSKGYRIISQDASKDGYRPDFIVYKHIRYGNTSYYKKVIIEVKSVSKVTRSHIRQINWYSKNHSGKHSFIIGKYLIIPSFTNISSVRHLIFKSGIKVIRLRGFRR